MTYHMIYFIAGICYGVIAHTVAEEYGARGRGCAAVIAGALWPAVFVGIAAAWAARRLSR